MPRKIVRSGALSVMPEKYEFAESLSGRVSVRRIRGRGSMVPVADLELVRSLLAWQPRLNGHIAERGIDEIRIHEPDPEPHDAPSGLSHSWGKWQATRWPGEISTSGGSLSASRHLAGSPWAA